MGSLLSKLEDDKDYYKVICKERGEKPQQVYSFHYYWMLAVKDNKTNLSFEDWKTQQDKYQLQKQIERKEQELNELKSKL